MRIKKLTIPDDVAAVLRRCQFTESTVVLPDEKLDRKLYEAVAKVLDAQGGKWNRKTKAHVFPESVDPRQVFADALASGEIVHAKKTLQAFYTPVTIAARVARRALIEPKQSVLEPSAGGGALIDAVLDARPSNLVLVEVDPGACELLRAKYVEHQGVRVIEGDFLRMIPTTGLGKPPPNAIATVDRIVMNPPFTAGQDVDHVEHAFRFLKPLGRLVAIMSPAIQDRDQKRYADFRDWLKRNADDLQIERIEPGAFKESGTDVATVMLSCRYNPLGSNR